MTSKKGAWEGSFFDPDSHLAEAFEPRFLSHGGKALSLGEAAGSDKPRYVGFLGSSVNTSRTGQCPQHV